MHYVKSPNHLLSQSLATELGQSYVSTLKGRAEDPEDDLQDYGAGRGKLMVDQGSRIRGLGCSLCRSPLYLILTEMRFQ